MVRRLGVARRSTGVPVPTKGLEERLFASALVNGGMNTILDKADIKDNELTLAKNARVRDDKTERRDGSKLYTPSRPNTNAVQLLFEFRTGRDAKTLLRVTAGDVHTSDETVWTILTGSLNGGKSDVPHAAIVLNTPIIANGVDRLQKVDLDESTVGDLDDKAPRARFVTGFFNRVVAASTGNSGDGLVTVYWSADRKIDEFDPVVDQSAGFSPIIESPADFSDFITGVFGMANVLILPRERSIWLANKQPSAQNPFNFFNSVPGLGCNVPSSIAFTKSGIVFFDTISENVWDYAPGGRPQAIGEKVRRDIIKNLIDPVRIVSGYLPGETEYYLGIPSDANTMRIWVYNFKTQGWAYDELDDVSTLFVRILESGTTTFDALTGTFDALTGTFDDLSDSPIESSRVYYGMTDGNILVQDDTVEIDNSGGAGVGRPDAAFDFIMESKEFKFPSVETSLSYLEFEYTATVAGSTNIEYSKDGGNTWIVAKTVKLVDDGLVQTLKYKRSVRTKRLMWRLKSPTSNFKLLNYEVHVFPGGEPNE